MTDDRFGLGPNSLVPELLVSEIEKSRHFWRDLLGFSVAYERPEEGFVFLRLAGVAIMLEEIGRAGRTWQTGPLEPPLGRGINFEITIDAVEPILKSLRGARWPLFMEPEERWYRAGDVELGVRQFLVQDPDGYLLRFAECLGQRPAHKLKT